MTPQEHLKQILTSGNIPHALLFVGPQGSGKAAAAAQFAVDLLKTHKKSDNHPDIHLLFPEGKVGLHSAAAIRNLSQEVSLAPFEGAWKIFIIHEADKMLPTSSNALLKTLEEPSAHTLIILLSDHPERLLPTISSRCQTIIFPQTAALHVDPTMLALLASGTTSGLSTFESDNPESTFETILLWYRDRLLLDINAPRDLLHFPQHLDALQKTPLIPLDTVQERVSLASLAHARSTKLSTCLEMLFLSLA